MIPDNAVSQDLTAFRAQLREQGIQYVPLLELNVWRPLSDIAFDWSTILLAAGVTMYVGWWLAPIAVVVIANRQRALGNILHDAAHRNLHRSRVVNDSIANALVAPLVFASLASYRDTHFKHHLRLGDHRGDPDYAAPPQDRICGWHENYARNVFSAKAWWGSLAGHLGGGAPASDRICIAAWWWTVACLMVGIAGPEFLLGFAALWLLARATAFHVTTVFREMCDHFGLQPGGVVSFTRDILRQSPWYILIHPRNNGYHLTHHLLPAVPYYRLPAAQKLFSRVPMYRERGRVFSSYLFGAEPVAAGWQTGGRL